MEESWDGSRPAWKAFRCYSYPIGVGSVEGDRGRSAAHKPLSSQCYRDLALVSRDGMNIVLNKINQILMEKYLKLQDTCRTQVRPERKERAAQRCHRG